MNWAWIFGIWFVDTQAIHGQAIDRHLLGLKMQGIEDLTSLPEIFMDTSYAVAMHFNLFTSQVSDWTKIIYRGWRSETGRSCTKNRWESLAI